MSSGRRLSSEEVRGMRDAYDGAIAYLDDQLAILLREMDKGGDLANTIVIVTSDHGEEFSEHGWVNHGNSLYYPGLHIPLLVLFPGRVPGGTRVSEGVTLRDLPATAVDLLGLGDHVTVPGRSWAAHWSSHPDSSRAQPSPLLSELKRPRDPPSWYAIAKGDMQSIIVGQHHYIRNGDGREELFDIVADPWETTDLSSRPDTRAILDTTRAALASAMAKGTQASAANSPK